ncbi:MAG: methyltransferase [Planctomycetota bacterium]
MLHELSGRVRAQVLSTLAAVGVPDLLRASGPRSVEALAAESGCDASDLESLLRAAAGLGCLAEPAPGCFALTARGLELCRDRLGALAAFLGSRAQWDGWSRLRDSMRDADPAAPLERAVGAGLYAHLAADPAAASEYDAAIDAFTRHEVGLLLDRIGLGAGDVVVDVGGGSGALLRALLERAAGARGVLFDLPHVVSSARSQLPASVEAVAGDFFESVPSGGDVYVLKHVLHNWSDVDAARILTSCRAACATGRRLAVVDAVLAPDNRPDLARLLDLEMRVLCGGRERRKPELRRLLQRTGWRVDEAAPLSAASWLFVCR